MLGSANHRVAHPRILLEVNPLIGHNEPTRPIGRHGHLVDILGGRLALRCLYGVYAKIPSAYAYFTITNIQQTYVRHDVEPGYLFYISVSMLF